MHIEFLLEEESAEEALKNIVPKILRPEISCEFHTYQGKPDLLNKLHSRLKGYRHWIPRDWRIVVLIDEDRQDCVMLKQQLENAAMGAGFITRTEAAGNDFQVLNRLAIEELEAWFFGDVPAIANAYPGIPLTLGNKARYRNPDTINGGTSKALERELQKAGHFKWGLQKKRAAQDISRYMNPELNRSRSFQVFRNGLVEMAGKVNS